MMISSRFTRWLTLVALAATGARANTWPLPPAGSNVVGENRFHVVENDGGSLEAIAKKYNVGFLALLQANPGVDPYVPRAGSVLTIPLQTILPDAASGHCNYPRRTASVLLPAGQERSDRLPYRYWSTGGRYADPYHGHHRL